MPLSVLIFLYASGKFQLVANDMLDVSCTWPATKIGCHREWAANPADVLRSPLMFLSEKATDQLCTKTLMLSAQSECSLHLISLASGPYCTQYPSHDCMGYDLSPSRKKLAFYFKKQTLSSMSERVVFDFQSQCLMHLCGLKNQSQHFLHKS